MKLHATESDTQRAILDYLAMKKIYAWRNNAGSQIIRNGDKFYRIISGPKGSSDIVGCLPDGRFLAIEVKRFDGQLSKEQIEFLERIISLGGVAFMAKSIDDVIKQFSFFEVKL